MATIHPYHEESTKKLLDTTSDEWQKRNKTRFLLGLILMITWASDIPEICFGPAKSSLWWKMKMRHNWNHKPGIYSNLGDVAGKRGYDQLIPDDFSICFAIWIYSRRPDLSRTRFFRKVACAWAIFTMTPCRPSQKLREETCLEVPTSFRLRNKPTISYHITWGFSHFVALFFPYVWPVDSGFLRGLSNLVNGDGDHKSQSPIYCAPIQKLIVVVYWSVVYKYVETDWMILNESQKNVVICLEEISMCWNLCLKDWT